MRDIEFRAYHKGEVKNVLWISLNHDELMFLNGINGYYQGRLKNCDLMQYTGLKDANGVKIFEGDIVDYVIIQSCYSDERRSAIKFKDGKFTKIGLCHNPVIAGNIYENPELLYNQVSAE